MIALGTIARFVLHDKDVCWEVGAMVAMWGALNLMSVIYLRMNLSRKHRRKSGHWPGLIDWRSPAVTSNNLAVPRIWKNVGGSG